MIDYRGPERLAALSRGAMTIEDAQTALSSPTLHSFERGEIPPSEFAIRMVEEWPVGVDPQTFIADFETWPEAFLPGASDILKALRGRYRLACLSNINIPHWRRAMALRVDRLFDHAFLSHEMGRRKPEPEIFEDVIAALQCTPGEILFFDDVAENIASAEKAGLSVQHIETPDRLGAAVQALI